MCSVFDAAVTLFAHSHQMVPNPFLIQHQCQTVKLHVTVCNPTVSMSNHYPIWISDSGSVICAKIILPGIFDLFVQLLKKMKVFFFCFFFYQVRSEWALFPCWYQSETRGNMIMWHFFFVFNDANVGHNPLGNL